MDSSHEINVATATLGCPVFKNITPLSAKLDGQNPRRAALAWTADGGCPYAWIRISSDLSLRAWANACGRKRNRSVATNEFSPKDSHARSPANP
jgi:hypothetical protein